MKQDIVFFVKKLISIPSVTQNPKEIGRALDAVRQELSGYAIKDYEDHGYPSFLAHNQKNDRNDFKVILNAHVDVVPGKKEQYQPFEKDGKIYGRGAYDMKGAAAVEILVFKEVAKKVSYPLALQMTSDEEVFSQYSTQYQIKQGIRGEFVLTGESSSDFVIKTEAKGVLWFTLTAKGKTAHGAYPWLGENALWKLIAALENLHKEFPSPQKESWVTTFNLAKIETTNITSNAIPDNATATIDMRFLPQEKDTILERVKKCIPEDIEMKITTKDTPVYISQDNPYLQELVKQTESVLQEKAQLKAVHASSDIRFYNEVGCLGVEFGPIGGNNHADDEWVDIASLEKYYEILKKFLLSLDK